MITLQKTGNGIKFTFQDNDHYLFNGTIEVPLNSLTLVTDESDMFTFKKSATNDIFISGLYSEIGMTKAQLEAFYKENMVGAGGTDEERVQELIDESVVNFFDGVEYDSASSRINFKHGTTVKGYVDASPFIVDGMVSNVEIANGNLVITFNVDSGKQPISIPLTDIFNPGNYYTKQEIDVKERVTSTALNDLEARKLDTSAYTPVTISEKNTWNSKQNALVSGTNIKTINNQSILGSGNIDIQGGGSISIGGSEGIEVNDISSDTYQIKLSGDIFYPTASRGNLSIGKDPHYHTLMGQSQFSCGYSNSGGSNATYSLITGYMNETKNMFESAFGFNNLSRRTDTSDPLNSQSNTLLTVGNGDVNSQYELVRHNALEIRKSGDIYIADTTASGAANEKPMINLQQTIKNPTSINGISFQRLTQAEYDALATKDENTMYIIIPPAPEYDYKLYFNVTDPTQEYLLFPQGSEYYLWGASELYVDNVLQPAVTNTYRFPSAGEHTVGINVDTAVTDSTTVHAGSFADYYNMDAGYIQSVLAYKIEIGGNITGLGMWAMCRIRDWNYDPTNPITVVLGTGITSMSVNLFEGSLSVTTLISKATTPPVFEQYGSLRLDYVTDIFVPAESVAAYKAAAGWSDYASMIQPIE